MAVSLKEVRKEKNQQGNANRLLLDYEKYASQFDEMCELVPAYQENIEILLGLVQSIDLPTDANICDLGAGTGNFICALAEVLPQANYTHLDMDPVMNSHAKSKYVNHNLANYKLIESQIQDAIFEPESFDLLLCVNALNTAPPQLPVLRMMRYWLKSTGTLFLIDFGRQQKVFDWTWYMFQYTYRNHGLGRVVRALWKNREAIKQNRRARQDQKTGRMWTHSTQEFISLVEKAGFNIIRAEPCYRGYSDLIIAKK